MRRFRFHIGTLLATVLILGIAFAALRESNQIWDSGAFTLTLGILLTSVLLAVHRIEKRRALWLGFALFGSAYLGLSLVASIEPRLITSKVLAFIDSKLPRSVSGAFEYFDYDNDGDVDLFVAKNPQPSALYVNKGNGKFEDVTTTVGLDYTGNGTLVLNNSAGLAAVGTSESFKRIGHSIFALLVAVFGGLLSQYLLSRNQGRTSTLSCPQTEQTPAEHLSGRGSMP